MKLILVPKKVIIRLKFGTQKHLSLKYIYDNDKIIMIHNLLILIDYDEQIFQND